MPVIRREAHGFCELWNVHKIRKQSKRPNAVTGKPFMLYYYPEKCEGLNIFNHGRPVDTKEIETLRAPYSDWDVDEYLPTVTLTWIRAKLAELDVNLGSVRAENVLADGSRFHVDVYLRLRTLIRAHFASGDAPILNESPKPLGGYDYRGIEVSKELALRLKRRKGNRGFALVPEIDSIVEELDVMGDGEDEALEPGELMENLHIDEDIAGE